MKKSNITKFCDTFFKESIIKKFGENMGLMEHYIFKETKFKNDKGLIDKCVLVPGYAFLWYSIDGDGIIRDIKMCNVPESIKDTTNDLTLELLKETFLGKKEEIFNDR